MKKPLLALTVAAVLSAAPLGAAQAEMNLDSAFKSLAGDVNGNFSTPGHYSAQTRNMLFLGGGQIRFAENKTLNLFSITPPKVSFGCGGIDFTFGGFSFINGEQIKALIQNIGKVAVAHVIMLAIKQLCPSCESIIEALMEATQAARDASLNSCTVGQNIGEWAYKGLGGKTNVDKSQYACSKASSQSGDTSDFASAFQNACSTVKDASKWFSDTMKKINDDGDSRVASSVDQDGFYRGNQTWQALQAMGMAPIQVNGNWYNSDRQWFGELMMSMVGAYVDGQIEVQADSDASPGEPKADNKPPQIQTADTLMHLFMCGSSEDWSDFGDGASNFAYGNSIISGGLSEAYHRINMLCHPGSEPMVRNLRMITCTDTEKSFGTTEETRLSPNCEWPELIPFDEWDNKHGWPLGKGMLHYVAEVLFDAYNNVLEKKALTAEQKKVIASIPLPLYKIINYAAVYPDVSAQLLETNAILAGALLSKAYFEYLLYNPSKDSPSRMPTGDPEVITRISDLLYGHFGDPEMIKEMDEMMIRQEKLIDQIRRMEITMQNTVFASGIMESGQFISEITTSVNVGTYDDGELSDAYAPVGFGSGG